MRRVLKSHTHTHTQMVDRCDIFPVYTTCIYSMIVIINIIVSLRSLSLNVYTTGTSIQTRFGTKIHLFHDYLNPFLMPLPLKPHRE